jgi:hypothetical protein
MILKKLESLWIASQRSFIGSTEKRILRSVLRSGRTFPGDVVRDLGISQSSGLKKILDLRHKGYLIRDNQSSFIRINPDKRKYVKIITSGRGN